jgi:ATP-dependent Clp protease ATP-binding subunit ClpC
MGLRDRYEAHHRVKYDDDAIRAAVILSDRYISGRFLPDKAIDVIDEAGAKLRLKATSKAPIYKELEKQIKDLERQKSEAVLNQDYEKAAEYRDQAERKKKELVQLKEEHEEKSKELCGIVDEDLIREVISKMTGIALQRIDQNEAKRLLELEDHLHKRVISQDEAINALARAIRRSRAGLKDPKRPVGSFIFVGPTGVGKTLLCKALAEFLFGEEDALIQIDMSEFMEKHNASLLVGAPPGYVGYEEGGQLTEKIRRRPYSVVLLDEIEKAHGDIYNMLLQIMEEGHLTDNFGRKIDFRNTVLIMTSNVGSGSAADAGALGFDTVGMTAEEYAYTASKDAYKGAMEDYFKPEFLNRLDEVIVFRPLERADLRNVVRLEFENLSRRVAKQGIMVSIDESSIDFLLDKGYNPRFGARPIRRTIEQQVEDPLSEALLRGEFDTGVNLELHVEDGHMVFKKVDGPSETEANATEATEEKAEETEQPPEKDAATQA